MVEIYTVFLSAGSYNEPRALSNCDIKMRDNILDSFLFAIRRSCIAWPIFKFRYYTSWVCLACWWWNFEWSFLFVYEVLFGGNVLDTCWETYFRQIHSPIFLYLQRCYEHVSKACHRVFSVSLHWVDWPEIYVKLIDFYRVFVNSGS